MCSENRAVVALFPARSVARQTMVVVPIATIVLDTGEQPEAFQEMPDSRSVIVTSRIELFVTCVRLVAAMFTSRDGMAIVGAVLSTLTA
jgi:hypothetical protein